jgi:hypothetical protein
MAGSCPMRDRWRCQCEIKGLQDATTVVLLIANVHTSQDHEEEQDIAYLSPKQKCLAVAAVKVAPQPMQTGKQLLQNIEGWPSKAIDLTLSKSLARMVRKERKSLTAVALEGVDVDNTLGSLVKSADVLWIENAFKLHKQEKCIDLINSYVIGRQCVASDRTMFLSVATC